MSNPQSQRQSQSWRPRIYHDCDCSMYEGIPHIVKSQRDWIRHLARRREDAVMQAVAAMENDPSPSPSESSSSSSSKEGEQSAEEYEPSGQPEDNTVDSPTATSESSSSSAVTCGPEPLDAEIDEDILHPYQHSTDNEHAAIASPAALENVSSPPPPAVYEDALIPQPPERYLVSAPQYNQQQLILPERIAPSFQSEPEDKVNPLELLDHLTPNPAEDSLEYHSSERIYSSIHSPDPSLPESEDSDTSSTDSSASGPIGQMNQGFVDVLREDEEEMDEYSDDHDDHDDDDDDDDDDDISVAESDTDSENVYPSGFDYKHPIGATFSRREMLSFGFNDITLKHKIPREAA
ncbi:hypothetical protein DFP73DRAFT_530083 [Morchella snyderi]|nr:hypothetical protein DFP73DRAFT_530083 [Morchella snyderi]